MFNVCDTHTHTDSLYGKSVVVHLYFTMTEDIEKRLVCTH